MRNILYKLQTYLPPEYFFGAAAVGALFLILSPQENLPVGQNAEAAAAVFAQARENPYENIKLEAKAAYVYDVQTRRPLFSKNARKALPIASVTKLMTAIAALSLIPETTYVTISARAVQEEGDSGFRVGERWLLRDILKLVLIESSNDGAVAVSSTVGATLATSTVTDEKARYLFIQEMNKLARTLNLSSARFLNETGLDLDEKRTGAEASAEDTAWMLAYALRTFPSIFRETRWSELRLGNENGETHPARNTNKDTNALPLLIASKTGSTDLAGGNLVIAFDAGFGRPIIISVLGSTLDGRFSDTEKLVWATFDYLNQPPTTNY